MGTPTDTQWQRHGRGTHYLCIRETMVLKAACTSAAEHVHTTGSVCRCRMSERNWGARAHGGLQPPHPTRPRWGDATHLPLPVGRVDEDDVLRQLVVRDENVVQLVVHGLPGDLQTQVRPHGRPGRRAPSPAAAARSGQNSALDRGHRLKAPWGRHSCEDAALPTCSWLRVSGQRSLSRLLARSFCGRTACRSFRDVLRPRRPASLPSVLWGQARLGQAHMLTAPEEGCPGWLRRARACALKGLQSGSPRVWPLGSAGDTRYGSRRPSHRHRPWGCPLTGPGQEMRDRANDDLPCLRRQPHFGPEDLPAVSDKWRCGDQ